MEFIENVEDIFFDSSIDDGIIGRKKYPTSSKKKIRKKEKIIPKQDQPVTEIFKLKTIQPMTKVQREFFESYCSGNHVVAHGSAGTGKSFLSIYLAMQDVLAGLYDKLIIIRTALEGRKIGFLPGNEQEKTAVFERPYIAIFEELFGKKNAYEMLKKRGLVEFESTSFLRGQTFNNAVIVYDEFQNGNWMEGATVLTRIGKNCKVVLAGDYKQSDHAHSQDREGVSKLMRILRSMRTLDFIEFTSADIVRSGFVKEFIIACERDEHNFG